MQVRAGCEAALSDCPDGASNRHVRSAADSFREIPEMAVAADVSVAVTNVDDVAVPALASRKDDDAVADGAHGSAHRRRVIGSLVLSPDSKHRVAAASENAGDAPEVYGRPKERSTKRLAALVEVLAVRVAAVESNRFDLVAGKRQPRAKNLVDYDRAVGLLKPLDENVEPVADLEILAHVDAVLEDVSERERQLGASRARKSSVSALVERGKKARLDRPAHSQRVDFLLVRGDDDYRRDHDFEWRHDRRRERDFGRLRI